jgi:ubiquinone/menaquinone biosynthesis C-methylase UbiE
MTKMTEAKAGQVSMTAAEIYDRQFVPALFGQFAPELADALSLRNGEAVLDVGCGTGIAALAAADRVGPAARVAAVDINPAMLAVARGKSDRIEWHEAPAETLPFDDHSFDAVMCQFALMFLADRTTALREMRRVARPGGQIGLLVWDSVANSPGYDILIPLLGEVVGPEAAEALSAPFCLGARADIETELTRAGLSPARILTLNGTARHASLDGWIDTEIGGWTLAETVSDMQKARLKTLVKDRLARFQDPDGRVAFPAPAHLVIVRF